MKRILFFSLISSLWSQIEFIPFDWGEQFGYVNKDGAIMWNEDWQSNRLFFDGTWSNYPKMYGNEIEDGFLNQTPDTSMYDSSRVTSYFKYDQGDYLLDRFSLGTQYLGQGRNVHFHAFKRSYAGTYGQYGNNSNQPIQQSYTVSYESKKGNDHSGISLGHFNTYSGIADSSTRGLIDNRITIANTFWDRSFGVFKTKISIDQFLQRYLANHSLSEFTGVRYLTRSRILGNLGWTGPDGTTFHFGTEFNQRNTRIDSLKNVNWSKLYFKGDWADLHGMMGLVISEDEMVPEIELNYFKNFERYFVSFEYDKNVKPTHVYESQIKLTRKILTQKTTITGELGWKSRKNKISFTGSHFNFYNNMESIYIPFLGGIPSSGHSEYLHSNYGFNYQTTSIPFLDMNFTYSNQKTDNVLSDGIADKFNLNTKTHFSLFDGFMLVDASLSLNGWLNREWSTSMHPIEMIPVSNYGGWGIWPETDSTEELDDVWFVNGSITAYVSTFTIKYEWFNITEIILASIGSDEENFFEIHPEMPRLGRQMNLSLEWHFLD
jgi:hypothetical protein